MSVETRHNIARHGPPGAQPMVFAHGFGCDQTMWRHVWPSFADDHRVVLFDWVGFGGSDASAFDAGRYSTLQGYAEDLLEVCAQLELRDIVFVGHSVSATIGILAAAAEPQRFSSLVLIGPSPRYLDDELEGYVGGFTPADIEDLLTSLESNYLGWSQAMAPAIMGNDERPELGQELANSFCRADPDIAACFARATFLSDNRSDLQRVTTPSLVLQCSDDVIAPAVVGEYVHSHLPGSTLVRLEARGHCPNLSAPEETVAAIKSFLSS